MTAPVSAGPFASFLTALGPRGRRRAEPRLSVALAGAGCVLALVGVLLVAGDTGSDDGGEFNRLPGIVLTGLVIAVGLVTVHLAQRGALAAAGTTAAALGVPAFLGFATFDDNAGELFATEVVIVSTLMWVTGYLVGPTRGRAFVLALALLGVWATLLEIVVDGGFQAAIGFVPAGLFGFFFFGSLYTDGDYLFGEGGGPDFTTIGLLSISVGVAYVLISRHLDRRELHGTSTPFALIAILALTQGVAVLIFELELAGTGLLAAAVGTCLAAHGATAGRRGTTWFGAGATIVGLAMFFGDMVDEPGAGGLLFMVAGVGLVLGGYALGQLLDEPDEMVLTEGVQPLRRPGTPGVTIVPPPDSP